MSGLRSGIIALRSTCRAAREVAGKQECQVVSALPLYLAYLATSITLIIMFTAIYMAVTPYRELALIAKGNRAAAISLGGVLIGFGLALASTAAHSTGLLDMAMWGGIALASQVAVFFVASTLFRGFRAGIEADQTSYGLIIAAMSVAMGLINAGALTY